MCQLPHHAAPARFLKAIGLLALVALASALVTGLLVNIYERKAEARRGPVRLVEVGEDDTDPAHWGINWPRQYDSYKRTAEATHLRPMPRRILLRQRGETDFSLGQWA